MARTPSNMLPLGTLAPDFSLYDTVSGKTLSLSELKGEKGTVVMFICNLQIHFVHSHAMFLVMYAKNTV